MDFTQKTIYLQGYPHSYWKPHLKSGSNSQKPLGSAESPKRPWGRPPIFSRCSDSPSSKWSERGTKHFRSWEVGRINIIKSTVCLQIVSIFYKGFHEFKQEPIISSNNCSDRFVERLIQSELGVSVDIDFAEGLLEQDHLLGDVRWKEIQRYSGWSCEACQHKGQQGNNSQHLPTCNKASANHHHQ